jgi:hypothetical protein
MANPTDTLGSNKLSVSSPRPIEPPVQIPPPSAEQQAGDVLLIKGHDGNVIVAYLDLPEESA